MPGEYVFYFQNMLYVVIGKKWENESHKEIFRLLYVFREKVFVIIGIQIFRNA